MKTAQDKITTAVGEYKRLFPQEYKDFQRGRQAKIDALKNDWASTGESTGIERQLYEVPEKLHNAIHRLLTGEELSWLNGRDEDKGKLYGAEWFMKSFPEFNISKEF